MVTIFFIADAKVRIILFYLQSFEEKVIEFITGKVKLTIKELSGEQLRAFDPDKK